ncbi:MAG: prenyltransferase/squalene oxidase repeat-containing protein [Planctomycetota bacterium]
MNKNVGPASSACLLMVLWLLLGVTGLSPLPTQARADDQVEDPVSKLDRDAIKKMIDRGANWIIDHQRPDGSWGSFAGDPGITAMALHAIIDSPRAYREEDGPFISAAVHYLLSHQQKDGGVYIPDQGLMNYKTSVTILALTALDAGRDKPRYRAEVARMRDYIAGIQCSEQSKPVAYDRIAHINSFGGIGYGSDRRPDLSNTQLALEALRAAGLSEDSDVWRRASVFISRCQNRKSSNDALDGKKQVSTEDGGFYYHPGESKASTVVNDDGSKSFSSYGSMTYAAVKSLIYAGLKRDDPRIVAAIDWIREHWSVDENPGMATPLNAARGQMGYYYYLAVMARALEVLGDSTLTDSSGQEHRWAEEIAGALLQRQAAAGSWSNEVDRWWEGDPVLATSYALQALNICYRNLED